MLAEHFHHAYLIEGNEIPEDMREFCQNSDLCEIVLDTFKIDDAKHVRALAGEKSSKRKIFAVRANSLTLDAQNALLKIFEEPAPDTHFLLIVPEKASLLPTLLSRFYHVPSEQNVDTRDAEKFIRMPRAARVEFLKELLTEEDFEDVSAELRADSPRSKALKFLNALERALHDQIFAKDGPLQSKGPSFATFDQIFTAREFIRMPGSSAKSLMESVALAIPNF